MVLTTHILPKISSHFLLVSFFVICQVISLYFQFWGCDTLQNEN